MIRLVAIARGGEVYITRDDQGIWRRHERYLPGPPVEINALEAQNAISAYGLSRVDEDYPSLQKVGERAEQLVIRRTEEIPVSGALVRALLPELRERVRLEGVASPDVVGLIGRLLLDDKVVSDQSLRTALAELLRGPTVTPAATPAPSRLFRMQKYFDRPLAAA